ncbi:MAG: hypothetical protein EOP83_05625 [Verrucomicrobiaceae bacterium]|nr:MAG: hypothetical protein EOP83_05625 [Verrucomicrobiaceae bacterium]
MRKHILLLEMHNLQMTLLEDRIEFLKKNFLARADAYMKMAEIPEQIVSAVHAQPGASEGEKLLSYVASFDPDKTKKYTQWFLNMILRKAPKPVDPNHPMVANAPQAISAMPLEDLGRARDYVMRFEEGRKSGLIPKEMADINKFKTIGDLVAVLNQGQQQVATQEESVKSKAYNESTVVLNTPEWTILTPKTMFAAQFFGVGTEWCTAYGYKDGNYPTRTDNMFDHYNKDGPLYILFNKGDKRKYQFHFESGQFMNINDQQLDMKAFLAKYPEIDAFFNPQDASVQVLAEISGFKVSRTAEALVFGTGGNRFFPDRTLKPFQFQLSGNAITSVPQRLRALIEAPKDRWGNRVYGAEENTAVKPYVGPNREALLKLLNDQNLTLGSTSDQHLAIFDIYFDDKNGHFGSAADVGSRELRCADGGEWVRVPVGMAGDKELHALTRNGKTQARSMTQDSVIVSALAAGASIKDVANDLTQLIMHHHEVTAIQGITVDKLGQENAKKIIETHTETNDLKAMAHAYGADDKRVQSAVEEKLKDAGFDNAEALSDGQMIISEYANPIDAAEENGTDATFLAYVQGDDHYETEGRQPDSYEMKDFIKKLDPAVREALGNYMRNTYPDELAELEEVEGIEYDAGSADDIMQLQDEVHDGDLNSAGYNAISSGYEVGAQNEIHEIFKRSFESNRYLYCYSEEQKKWVKEMLWDTRVAVIAPIDEIVQEIGDDNDFTQLNYDGWLEAKDEKFKPEFPHHGLTDSDDEAAQESFAENVSQFI